MPRRTFPPATRTTVTMMLPSMTSRSFSLRDSTNIALTPLAIGGTNSEKVDRAFDGLPSNGVLLRLDLYVVSNMTKANDSHRQRLGDLFEVVAGHGPAHDHAVLACVTHKLPHGPIRTVPKLLLKVDGSR